MSSLHQYQHTEVKSGSYLYNGIRAAIPSKYVPAGMLHPDINAVYIFAAAENRPA